MGYVPYEKRSPDTQYRNLLESIYRKGVKSASAHSVESRTLFGSSPRMVFDLSKGFPLITERDCKGFWQSAIAELIAFINGARTQRELVEDYGVSPRFWSEWTEGQEAERKAGKRGLSLGDLGPGSYGAAFHDFPMPDGKTYNQFEAIVAQIKERPELRTHWIDPWIPFYTARVEGSQQKVIIPPCHGWIHIRIIEERLHLHMTQRSGDTVIGVPSNLCQYAALTMMIAQATAYWPGTYSHSISDAHIYENQFDSVEEMLSREPRRLPTVHLMNGIHDLFAFRKEHFTLEDYDPHPAIKGIPVAV